MTGREKPYILLILLENRYFELEFDLNNRSLTERNCLNRLLTG